MAVRDVLRGAVERVELQSQLTPTVRIVDPFMASGGDSVQSNVLLHLLKPQLVVVLRNGEVLNVAPAGAPNPAVRNVVLLLTLVTTLVSIAMLVRWMRR